MIKKIKYLFGLIFCLFGFSFCFGDNSLVSPGFSATYNNYNVCTINPTTYSINCSKSSHVISAVYGDDDNFRVANLFWASDGFGVYFFHKFNGEIVTTGNSATRQGLIKGPFFVCVGDTLNDSNLSGHLQGSSCPQSYTTLFVSYDELLDLLNKNRLLYSFIGYPGNANITLVFDGFYFNLIVSGNNGTNGGNGTFVSQNLGFIGDNQSNINFNNSNVVSYPLGGYINGSSGIGQNTNLTGNVMYNTCTNGYIINQLLKYQYNGIDVCYSNSNNTGLIDSSFDGSYSYVNNGLDLSDLLHFEDGLGGEDLFSANGYYNWYVSSIDSMTRYKQGRLGNNNPFLGRSIASYSYFERLYYDSFNLANDRWFGDPIFNLNFCALYLKSDRNAEYTGKYFSDECKSLNNFSNDGSYTTGFVGDVGSGEVLPIGFDVGVGNGTTNKSGVIVGVDWSGTLSGDINRNFEGKTFINDFYQKLQSSFQNPANSLFGIVPSYILVFMFALILFRFLSH